MPALADSRTRPAVLPWARPLVVAAALAAAWMPAGQAMAALAIVMAGAPPERFRYETTPSVLDKAVRPLHYRLTLELDPARDDFQGEVTITLQLRQARPLIELHAHELTALAVHLHDPSGSRGQRGQREMAVQPDAERQTWRLVPRDGRPVPAGRQRLTLRYSGLVHAQGHGLFHATVPGSQPPQRMLATQLEAVHARTLFPGFDEPLFRAAFELSVRTPAGLEALSNMPRQRSVTLADGRLQHHFAATPAMPSYLLAVTVGRFDVLEGRAAGVPLRILTAPGKREQARYAMQVTEQLLPAYSRYFGQPYALPRLDQLAVPGTRRGAMEDWGLISYAENLLLFDPARSSANTQRWVYSLVAHEVSHQWFGNLVTAASWSEIWLNEAFATWMAAKVTDRFNPAWQVRLNDRLEIDESMGTDATDATRAIRSGPVGEQQVDDVFDDITYTKGGAVLGMLEQWLGEERFQHGLASYMRERRLSNATAGDLWFHIGRAAGRDVAGVASSWTDQPGFPLVHIETRCEAGRTVVDLRQQRFRQEGRQDDRQNGAADASSGGTGPRWQIPLRLARGGELHQHLLRGEHEQLTLKGCRPEPLIANADGVGYYRVAYDPAQRAELLRRLPGLAPADRLVLFTDTAALAQTGRVPMTELVQALGRVPQAAEPGRAALWRLAADQFTNLDHTLAGSPAQAALRAAAGRLIGAELQRLGWGPRAGEEAETEALRADLIGVLGRLGDGATITQARRLLAQSESSGQPLPASLRSAVIRSAAAGAGTAAGAGDAELAALRQQLLQATSEEDRWILLGALTTGRSAAEATALLDWALQAELPTNVAGAFPRRLAMHSGQAAAAYAHVLTHWAAWERLAGPRERRSLLPDIAYVAADASLADRLLADQVRLLGSGEADGSTPAARAAAQIRHRAALRSREAQALTEAFERLAR
jgi:aminopeptidase N